MIDLKLNFVRDLIHFFLKKEKEKVIDVTNCGGPSL
jgi:hypothetical protein